MKRRIVVLLVDVGVAALLMWFRMWLFWLYFFAVILWNFSRVLAVLAANHLELRVHLETIQNRVGVVPSVDANAVIEQMRHSTSEKDWKEFCEIFRFARSD